MIRRIYYSYTQQSNYKYNTSVACCVSVFRLYRASYHSTYTAALCKW